MSYDIPPDYDEVREMDYTEPPHTEWGEFAILSAAEDPFDYENIHGAVKDIENWTTLQEQIIVPFETYDDFPAEGPFDGARAEAKDMNVVFQWDGDSEDWKPLNTGTPDAPIPGTSHYEGINAGRVDIEQRNLDVLIDDLGEDDHGHIFRHDGSGVVDLVDGTSTMARGPYVYDHNDEAFLRLQTEASEIEGYSPDDFVKSHGDTLTGGLTITVDGGVSLLQLLSEDALSELFLGGDEENGVSLTVTDGKLNIGTVKDGEFESALSVDEDGVQTDKAVDFGGSENTGWPLFQEDSEAPDNSLYIHQDEGLTFKHDSDNIVRLE
ncbi:hypothetical protein RBH26_21090 [Natronolimnohabitans sp. A-GB9]|uniref:hypothetical protein n=1 Tax=Natronolimnohabitans sp. A-GB9 TaxID=3069757 RepID=UPI0027B10D39|nr:hypothetical protein [Natronolimnohabitans sp. A-GB9]MDQ2052941.1 hypothetical protein [Natronolimnohabitans sp. A-GB9]